MRPGHETFRDESYRDINREIGYALARRGNALLKQGKCGLAIEDFAQAREHGIDADDPVVAGECIARSAVRDWLANRPCAEVPNVNLADFPAHLVVVDGEVIDMCVVVRTPESRQRAIDHADMIAADEELRFNFLSAKLVDHSTDFDVEVYDFDGQRVELIHTAKPSNADEDENEDAGAKDTV